MTLFHDGLFPYVFYNFLIVAPFLELNLFENLKPVFKVVSLEIFFLYFFQKQRPFIIQNDLRLQFWLEVFRILELTSIRAVMRNS